MDRHLVHTELGTIEYTSIGTGIPVVFLHGGHSNCKESLSHKGLDPEEFQLITPSRPGYGKTDFHTLRTPQKSAHLIRALLDVLQVDQFVVYGISAGGPTAIALAAQYPNRVSKLVLASAVTKKWLNKNEKTYKTAQVLFNPKIEKFTWGMVKWLSRAFPKIVAKNFFKQFSKHSTYQLRNSDVHELIAAMNHYNSGYGFLNDIDQIIPNDLIAKVKCPTLIIHSENDNTVSIAHARHAHRMIENSMLEILRNEWGHLFWIGNDSKKTISKVERFIGTR